MAAIAEENGLQCFRRSILSLRNSKKKKKTGKKGQSNPKKERWQARTVTRDFTVNWFGYDRELFFLVSSRVRLLRVRLEVRPAAGKRRDLRYERRSRTLSFRQPFQTERKKEEKRKSQTPETVMITVMHHPRDRATRVRRDVSLNR